MHFAQVVAPLSTLWDLIAIAKLRIIDECELNLALRDMDGGSVKELKAVCKRRLRQHLPVMANMRWEEQLLLLKFNDCFYE